MIKSTGLKGKDVIIEYYNVSQPVPAARNLHGVILLHQPSLNRHVMKSLGKFWTQSHVQQPMQPTRLLVRCRGTTRGMWMASWSSWTQRLNVSLAMFLWLIVCWTGFIPQCLA